ncbi:MAG: toxin-antitoxin system HicB family antitoxin [Thermomicrobiales bacterium]
MSTTGNKSLEEYLALEYPFQVIADPDGGYVVDFPDLPGCMTQADSYEEIAVMAQDARTLWIETAYDHGRDIPLPSYPEEHSGKFNLRLPRSLHRKLAESADQEGVSLNQYVTQVLARGDAQTKVERQLETLMATVISLETQIAAINERLRPQAIGNRASRQRQVAPSPQTDRIRSSGL